jgi:hypothetical protein
VPLDREIETSVMIRKQEVINKRGHYKWPKLDDLNLGLFEFLEARDCIIVQQ